MTLNEIKSGALLVLNSGSSSVKFTIFKMGEAVEPLFAGQLDGIGSNAKLKAKNAAGERIADENWEDKDQGTVPSILPHLLEWIEANLPEDAPLVGAGHRVVHGGEVYDKPVKIDADILEKLKSFIPLAPLHQPQNLAAIEALATSRPDLPQVACFDTAFHQTQPELSTTFPIPRRFTEEGVRRYGFHGLSYEYIAHSVAQTMPEFAEKRVVVAHLGSGASVSVLENGASVETSMGFSALDGVMMGTRPGSLDPGILIHLMREHKLSADEMEQVLYRESGLLGVSGISNDMRELDNNDDPKAVLAVKMFQIRVAKQIVSLAVSTGGVDAIVFTAGIGENSALHRGAICEYLKWIGVELDEAKNSANELKISTDGSLPVFIIPTDEEFMIARHTVNVLTA